MQLPPTLHPIAFHRKGLGLTQTDLALRLGVAMKSVQSWETKGATPHPRRIGQMATLFGMKGEALLAEIQHAARAYREKVSVP